MHQIIIAWINTVCSTDHRREFLAGHDPRASTLDKPNLVVGAHLYPFHEVISASTPDVFGAIVPDVILSYGALVGVSFDGSLCTSPSPGTSVAPGVSLGSLPWLPSFLLSSTQDSNPGFIFLSKGDIR